MLVNQLACTHPERFKAAVSNSGTTASNVDGDMGMLCPGGTLSPTGAGTISYLMLSGAADLVVPIRDADYTGSQGSGWPSYDYFMKMSAVASEWSGVMGCQDGGTAIEPAPKYQSALGGIHCTRYSSCGPLRDEIEYCTWGTNPESLLAQAGGNGHIYMGCGVDMDRPPWAGYCVESSVQGSGYTLSEEFPDQTGYPECLADGQNPYPCFTDLGTEFIWGFLSRDR